MKEWELEVCGVPEVWAWGCCSVWIVSNVRCLQCISYQLSGQVSQLLGLENFNRWSINQEET